MCSLTVVHYITDMIKRGRKFQKKMHDVLVLQMIAKLAFKVVSCSQSVRITARRPSNVPILTLSMILDMMLIRMKQFLAKYAKTTTNFINLV